MQAGTVARVAAELYGLPPAEFTAARDEQARAARAAGRRGDADAIKKLARPTTSAWLINRLSRDEREPLRELFELADALQEAQRTLAGGRLRQLSARRRQVVSDLLPVAAGLANQASQPASAAVLDEVRATLEAALADENARDAVRSGRLTKGLAYAGLGEVDLSAAVARPEARPAPRPGPAVSEPDEAQRAAQAVAAAESEVATASDSVAAAESELTAIAERRQFLRRRIEHLTRELAQVKDEDADLMRDADRASRSRDAAAAGLKAAQHRLAEARAAASAVR